jgi:hypothetical protein
MWIINDSPVEDKLQTLISKLATENTTYFPETCPICSTADAHVYYNARGKNKLGGVWVWCSACRHYFHGSTFPPEWWENYCEIPQNELTAIPDILEKFNTQIDRHINDLIIRRKIE